MTYKNLRYSHKCYEEPQPVKPHAKPKADDELSPSSGLRRDDEVPQTQTFIKKRQATQPITPASALAQHYQLISYYSKHS